MKMTIIALISTLLVTTSFASEPSFTCRLAFVQFGKVVAEERAPSFSPPEMPTLEFKKFHRDFGITAEAIVGEGDGEGVLNVWLRVTDEKSGFEALSGATDLRNFAFVSLMKGSDQFRMDCGPTSKQRK